MAFQFDYLDNTIRFWWRIKTQTGDTIEKAETSTPAGINAFFRRTMGRSPNSLNEACELFDACKKQEFEAEARDKERLTAKAKAVRAAELAAGVPLGAYREQIDQLSKLMNSQLYETARQKPLDDYAKQFTTYEKLTDKSVDEFLEKFTSTKQAWISQPVVSRIPPFTGRRQDPMWADDIDDEPEPPEQPKPTQNAPSTSEMTDRFKNLEIDT